MLRTRQVLLVSSPTPQRKFHPLRTPRYRFVLVKKTGMSTFGHISIIGHGAPCALKQGAGRIHIVDKILESEVVLRSSVWIIKKSAKMRRL